MNNYAIVIGIPEYENATSLPACQNDAKIMCELLEATKRFNVLSVAADINKSCLLEEIEKFLPLSEDNPIGDIIFYFSGHGCSSETDTHFILKDTSIERLSSTSLNNSELDAIIRKRNPRLFVKVLDACESGLNYIKSPTTDTEIGKVFYNVKDSEKKLGNCFFMCSSKNDQSSIATEDYSLFTREFIMAVANLIDNKAIRYIDILNYISDVFRGYGIDQTPYFTTQSDGLDIFAEMTPELEDFAKRIRNLVIEVPEEKNTVEAKLDKYIEQFRTADEIKVLMEKALEIMSKIDTSNSWLSKYYMIELSETGGFRDYRKDKTVLKFISQRHKRENLYINLEFDKQTEETMFGISTYKDVPTEYFITEESLPKAYCYKLEPKSKALPLYQIFDIFIYGRTFFYVIQVTKQYIHNGNLGYETKDVTKYFHRKFVYCWRREIATIFCREYLTNFCRKSRSQQNK